MSAAVNVPGGHGYIWEKKLPKTVALARDVVAFEKQFAGLL